MNFYALSKLICRWKGHRRSKAKIVDDDTVLHGMQIKRVKHCLRCPETREVKQRKPKAAQ